MQKLQHFDLDLNLCEDTFGLLRRWGVKAFALQIKQTSYKYLRRLRITNTFSKHDPARQIIVKSTLNLQLVYMTTSIDTSLLLSLEDDLHQESNPPLKQYCFNGFTGQYWSYIVLVQKWHCNNIVSMGMHCFHWNYIIAVLLLYKINILSILDCEPIETILQQYQDNRGVSSRWVYIVIGCTWTF